MRFVLFALLASCAGKVTSEPTDAETTTDSTTALAETAAPDVTTSMPEAKPPVDTGPSVTPGCPATPPTTLTDCISSTGIVGDNFYCHYFQPGKTCVTATKCSNAKLSPVGPEDCTFKPTDCVTGAMCGRVFERDGACIVMCQRVCKCDPMTGKLICVEQKC